MNVCMTLDARTKQVFPAILAALVMLVAYLQAMGLAQLFAAHIGNVGISAPQPLDKQAQPFTAWAKRDADGSAILARNPFDSVTGPLNGTIESNSTAELAQKNKENPYADPLCDMARVLLITTTDDPTWSFASIAIGSERATLRRIGDDVGDKTVYAMTWDRVWMVKSGLRCQVQLGSKVAAALPPPQPQPPTPSGILGIVAGKIHRITDTQFDVDRSVIQTAMENQAELFGRLRIAPTHDADGASLKLGGIRAGSTLSLLGLANGDKLQKINKFDMSDPMIAMQAYSRLLTADKLDVQVVRAGKPVSIEINLR
jgi:general secretion pathway protein C